MRKREPQPGDAASLSLAAIVTFAVSATVLLGLFLALADGLL